MADELEAPSDRRLGFRHDRERRRNDRRGIERSTSDRRRGERRRAGIRNLVFTMMAVSVPHQVQHTELRLSSAVAAPEARVSTTIDSFIATPASQVYDSVIQEAATLYRVSPTLIRSVMQVESAFDPLAISPAGAMGLMQLMPEVATAFGIDDPFNSRDNIMGGARLLRELLDSHHNNLPLVLAAYNAGPAAVARYGGIPPFPETRGYVKKITTLLKDARTARLKQSRLSRLTTSRSS